MARPINAKVGKKFAEKVAYEVGKVVCDIWSNKVECCCEANDYGTIRQFTVYVDHSWGTAYVYWTDDTKRELIEKLRELGATNIKFYKFKWNRIYAGFDLKVKKQKELESEVNVA